MGTPSSKLSISGSQSRLFSPKSLLPKLRLRAWLCTCVALTMGLSVAAASYAVVTGGKDISSARSLERGERVTGQLGGWEGSWGNTGGEYYKIRLAAGDRVRALTESAGDVAPCVYFYPPGTNDFNFRYDRPLPFAAYNDNGRRRMRSIIAGRDGDYIVVAAWGESFDAEMDCTGPAYQWPYSLTIYAPHFLQLSLPHARVLGRRRHLNVLIHGALSTPVNDQNLRVRLTAEVAPGQKIMLGDATAISDQAVFRLRLPRTVVGRRIRFVAAGGDGFSWTPARASRWYVIR